MLEQEVVSLPDTEEKVYSFNDSLEAALKELEELDKLGPIIAPQMYLLAGKYAPRSLAACVDVIRDNLWFLGMPSVEGRLLKDTIIGTVASVIEEALIRRNEEYIARRRSEMIQAQSQAQFKQKRLKRNK